MIKLRMCTDWTSVYRQDVPVIMRGRLCKFFYGRVYFLTPSLTRFIHLHLLIDFWGNSHPFVYIIFLISVFDCVHRIYSYLLLARLMGQYCFACCRLSLSSVVVCNAAGGRAGRQPVTWAIGRPTLHGGPVRLRLFNATPCFLCTRCTELVDVYIRVYVGAMQPVDRSRAWRDKRVFYLTPQVISNDLSRSICPAESIKCLVIDEAHKALGNHSYCQVVRELVKVGHCHVLLELIIHTCR